VSTRNASHLLRLSPGRQAKKNPDGCRGSWSTTLSWNDCTTSNAASTKSGEQKFTNRHDRKRQLSTNDVVAQFCDEMRAHGLIVNVSEVIPNHHKPQRCKTDKDRGGRKNGYFRLYMDGTPAGFFGSWTGGYHTWRADTGSAPMSAEEEAKLRAERQRRKAEHAAAMKVAQDEAAAKAKKKWAKFVEATDEHGYLQRKGVRAHGLRIGAWWGFNHETSEPYVVCPDALIVPMYDLKRDIKSLQGIFPQPIEINGERRDKCYLAGGQKDGLFHLIGKPQEIDGRKVFVIAEGLATAASIHECTGHAVLVAFDTSNLLHVGRVVRGKYSDAVILFAADNDFSTVAPVSNPGVLYANKAAADVGGVVAIPYLDDVTGLKGVDFNDLHQREGAGAVEAWLNAALYPAEAEHEADTHDRDQRAHTGEQGDVPARQPAKPKPTTQADATDAAVADAEKSAGFRILGHNRETIYIFVHGMRQIIERDTFPQTTLLHMAPLNWWESNFPNSKSGGINANAAAEFIIRTAQRRGLYDPNCVRNGGAWMDAGRHVFHHGDHLTVNGKHMPVTAIRSKFVYEQTLPLPTPADVALTDAEGRHIYDIAKRFNWERNSSAALLAGWTFLAPICGALKWRPHIFLTGPAGNGKSTILRDYVHALIGEGGCVYAQGSSTEAGVRQDIGSTSLPCLIDEAERNTEREKQRIEALLALIRQSSTESAAKTLKGTVGGEGMKFNVRSMFALAAIFTGLERKADIDRLSVLSLKPSRGDADAAKKWDETKDLLHVLGREGDNMRGKMMRRALDVLPFILANSEVFKRVAAEKFKSQRDGDQYGTMMAGAWSLTNSTLATPDQALAMMNALDWTEHAEATEADDSQSALQELMGAFIQVQGIKHTVHNLITFALGEEVEGRTMEARQAKFELRQHGIVLEGTKMLLSNSSSAIKKLLTGTPFATDPKSAFGRLPGAGKNDGRLVRFNGVRTRVTSLPLECIGFGGRSISSEGELF
jgi:putative DNA primase/helicase